MEINWSLIWAVTAAGLIGKQLLELVTHIPFFLILPESTFEGPTLATIERVACVEEESEVPGSRPPEPLFFICEMEPMTPALSGPQEVCETQVRTCISKSSIK